MPGLIRSLTDREFQKFKEVQNLTAVNVNLLNQLVPEEHDALLLGYDTASNLTTVNYFEGGTSGTQVATLTLGYSGSDLISVEKT